MAHSRGMRRVSLGWTPIVLTSLLSASVLVLGCAAERVGDDAGGDARGDSDDPDGGDDARGEWTACDERSDCALVSRECCGTCEAASLDDFDAINVWFRRERDEHVCGGSEPSCPLCGALPNPWLIATCDASTCVGVDLHTQPFNTCETDDDCRLRSRACCECGATMEIENIVAVPAAAEAAVAEVLCDEDAQCPECDWDYPPELSAVCRAGRCDLEVND